MEISEEAEFLFLIFLRGWEEGSGDGDFRIGGGSPFEFFYLWGTFLNIGKSIRGGI